MAKWSSSRRGFGALGLAGLLAACGFRPVYAPGQNGAAGPAATGLSEISVPVIPERSGQLLRQALQDRFERSGAGGVRLYDLIVGYSVSSEGVGFNQDSSTSYNRMVARATWSLLSLDSQRKTVTSGVARSMDGYNSLDNQYFAVELEGEAAQRRLAEAVADQVTQQLAVYFNSHPSGG